MKSEQERGEEDQSTTLQSSNFQKSFLVLDKSNCEVDARKAHLSRLITYWKNMNYLLLSVRYLKGLSKYFELLNQKHGNFKENTYCINRKLVTMSKL